MDRFKEKFCERYRLSETDIQTLLDCMQHVHFRKNDVIVCEGTRDTNLYLIEKGIWRGNYLKDGVDTTLWFAAEGEVAFSIWGYAANSLSQITIEAMSDSTAYYISGKEFNDLCAASIELANLGRSLMEHQLLFTDNWLISGGSPRAKERYLTLLKETPELLQFVPLKYIASYLWITPQSLSRIRAEIAFIKTAIKK